MEVETSLRSSERTPAAAATSLSPYSSLDASLNSSLATTSSSASSLAGSLSISSLDSTLLSRYTSCALLNLPTKLLACSPPLESPPLSLTLLDGLVIAGTQAHGIVSLDPTKHLSRAAAFGSSSSNSGGAVKALLALTQQQQLISGDQRGRIRVWRRSRRGGGSDDWDFEVAATLPTTTDVLRSAVLPGNYVRLRWQLWLRHADTVSSLAVSAGAKLLVSASWDRSIKVWRSRRCIASLASAHDDAVNAIVAADRFFYTGGADGKVKAWELVGERKPTVALVATLYSAGADRVIVVWEREEAATHMSKADVLKGHRMPVLCLAISSSKSGQYSILCSGSVSGCGLQGTPGAGQGSGYPPRRAEGCRDLECRLGL